MFAWHNGLSHKDNIIAFAHLLGFIQFSEKKYYLQLTDVIDYYGCSSDIIIHHATPSELKISFGICDTFQVSLLLKYLEKDEFQPADLKILVFDQRKKNHPSPFSLMREVKYYPRSRKYFIDALGNVALTDTQVANIIEMLSKLREEFDAWHLYMDS